MNQFKPTITFLESFLKGKISKFCDKRTFAQRLEDLLAEIQYEEPGKIERTLLFDSVVFELDDDKNKVFIRLVNDGKELFYIEKYLERTDNIGSVTLQLDAGMMQMFLT